MLNIDEVVKSQKSSLSLEGRELACSELVEEGEGNKHANTICYAPPSLNPLPPGEGKLTFATPSIFKYLFLFAWENPQPRRLH